MPCPIILEVESPDDQVYFRQNKGIKQSKNKKEKQKSRLLSQEQVLDTSECFSSKNFK